MRDASTILREWETSAQPPPYLLLDAAAIGGADEVEATGFQRIESLFLGDLADELRNVGPYLAYSPLWDDFPRARAVDLLRRQAAIAIRVADPATDFATLHRHLRKFNVVYGPDGNPIYCRYYDARCLIAVLRSFEPGDRPVFFGPVDSFWRARDDGGIERIFLLGDEIAFGS
jgi:hypothetical protein